MIIDWSEWTRRNSPQLVTIKCPLCDALKGRDYGEFAWHVYSDHEWSDVVGGDA